MGALRGQRFEGLIASACLPESTSFTAFASSAAWGCAARSGALPLAFVVMLDLMPSGHYDLDAPNAKGGPWEPPFAGESRAQDLKSTSSRLRVLAAMAVSPMASRELMPKARA